jgi:hypothetical protein
MLTFDIIEKCCFVTKVDQNTVFPDHEGHIPNQLYMIVLCITDFKKGAAA